MRVIKQASNFHEETLNVKQKLINAQKTKIVVDTDVDTRATDNKTDELFELSRTVTVLFNKVNDYNKFLNAAVKIGVTQIYPLTMTINDADEYYQQALLTAIDNAKEKALNIAKQTGQQVGKLIYVKEMSNNHYRPQYRGSMMVNAFSEHNSHTGAKEITASVLVNFELKE